MRFYLFIAAIVLCIWLFFRFIHWYGETDAGKCGCIDHIHSVCTSDCDACPKFNDVYYRYSNDSSKTWRKY